MQAAAEAENIESDEEAVASEESASECRDDSDDEPLSAVANVPIPGPRFSLGGLVPVAPAAKKKGTAKKKAKKPETDNEFDTGSGTPGVVDVTTEATSQEVEDAIERTRDVLLKQVVRALDSAPPCLLGLLPETTFKLNQKVGHQLKGATWHHFLRGRARAGEKSKELFTVY